MSAYTPGPWTWDEPSNWHGLSARVYVPEPYGVVAKVPIEAWRPRSIGKANARLIAAAPELLEALKEAYEDTPGWVDKCKAAIAKAEGKQ